MLFHIGLFIELRIWYVPGIVYHVCMYNHIVDTLLGIPDIQPTTTTITPVLSTVVNPTAISSTVLPSVTTTSISATSTPHPVVAVPANVEQIFQGLTSVQIHWITSQEHVFFHVKLYCTMSCAGNVMRNLTTENTEITVYGLEPNNTYVVRVAAETSDGILSQFSEPLLVSTVTTG